MQKTQRLFIAMKNFERVEATRDAMDGFLRESNPRSSNFDDEVIALGNEWEEAERALIS